MAEQIRIDVQVRNEGSLFLFDLLTDTAKSWVTEHVKDDAQFWGPSLAVQPRYAGNLATAMQKDGLCVR